MRSAVALLEAGASTADHGYSVKICLIFFFFFLKKKSLSDKVIRENPASRGTEASAEVLVGPPMTDGVERRSTAVVLG